MCGIAGFMLGERKESINGDPRALLSAMGQAIAHRGPDDSGVLFLAEAGLGLAHRRLSIIDLSPAGHQPMNSACGRFSLAFNGEIYNFAELKEELESAGHAPSWNGTSDTEVMLAAFTVWGVEASCQRFNGMFAFALWDREAHELTLARDRVGEKPLYYTMVRGVLVFGSELRALCAYPGFDRSVDAQALGQFLRLLAVPSPNSIYSGVRKLPPGCFMTVTREHLVAGLPAPEAYWKAKDVFASALSNRFGGTLMDAVESLDTILRRSISKRVVSDVPLGAFLSGGFDSTLIVALMQAQSSRPIRTFTIGFDEAGFDESPFAAAVAKHLGADHVEARVTSKDALDTIMRLPSIYDEPFADSSQIPTAILCALVREHMTVALTGDAGDELFGGYQRYFATAQGWNAIKAMPLSLRRSVARAYSTFAHRAPASLTRKRTGVMRFLNPDFATKIADALSARDDQDLYERFLAGLSAPPHILQDALVDAASPVAEQWPLVPGDLFHKMMFMDFCGYLPDDILVKVDRAAMAVGLETRVPFLDPQVVEFAWSLPLSMKVEAGRGKLVLRKLVERYVPADLMNRPKQGFGLPLGEWLKGPLRPWAESLLSEARLRADGYFDAGAVRRAWHDHLSSARMGQPRVWPVLMFNAWYDAMRQPAGFGASRPGRAA